MQLTQASHTLFLANSPEAKNQPSFGAREDFDDEFSIEASKGRVYPSMDIFHGERVELHTVQERLKAIVSQLNRSSDFKLSPESEDIWLQFLQLEGLRLKRLPQNFRGYLKRSWAGCPECWPLCAWRS